MTMKFKRILYVFCMKIGLIRRLDKVLSKLGTIQY